MRTDEFDFALPEDRIALRPATPRDSARLLVVRPGAPVEDRAVGDLPSLLRNGDALVVNDTKVMPANLHGRRLGRGGDGDREPANAATCRCRPISAAAARSTSATAPTTRRFLRKPKAPSPRRPRACISPKIW